MTFESGLSFWPSGTYGQIYASALMACLLWVAVYGNRNFRMLCAAMLLGWLGARLSTSETSFIPIVLFSAIGGVIAVATRTTTGAVIAGLYGAKIIWCTVSVATGLPGWILFEISTLIGWLQIAALMIGQSISGKGAFKNWGMAHENGSGIIGSSIRWAYSAYRGFAGFVFRTRVAQKSPENGRVSGGNRVAGGKD